MVEKIIDFDNIKNLKIDTTVTRVKAFVFNGDFLYLDKIDYGYMLPGGHVEENEDFDLALIREVEEETGIKLDKSDKIQKFYITEKYTKNYKNTAQNRLNRIVYYIVKTNKTPNLNNINLTQDEREHDLKVEKVSVSNFENTLKNTIKNEVDPAFTVIANEMLDAFQILKQHIKN